MPPSSPLVGQLESSLGYFKKTLSAFAAEDSRFAPDPALFTVAGHVAHVADTVEWFVEGAFGDGWDLDFDASVARAKEVTSLEEATVWLDGAYSDAMSVVGKASAEALGGPIPDARIMKGAPRSAIVGGIVDHTAHHRGALAVYARLCGKVPPMPYA